jgi:hypothetical protein
MEPGFAARFAAVWAGFGRGKWRWTQRFSVLHSGNQVLPRMVQGKVMKILHIVVRA